MDIAMLEVYVWVAMGSLYESLGFRGFQGYELLTGIFRTRLLTKSKKLRK